VATIDNEDIIRALIKGNGVYPGDEGIPQGPVVRIVQYTNAHGVRTYGVVYEREAQMGMLYRYDRESEFVRDPAVIFERP
jgi:hypothetical protein